MTDLLQDLRSSIRSIRRRPFYPLVIVGILTVGLTTAIAALTYINGFYQPFPGANADKLIRIYGVDEDDANQNISYLDYRDYSSADQFFDGFAASQPYYAASVRLETMTEVAFLEAVSGNYFDTLEIKTSTGRGLVANDDRAEADPVAVISHAWWRRTFNSDPSVIGSTLYLNSRPFTLVGVADPEYLGTTSDFRPDVWVPIAPFADRYIGWARAAEDRDTPLVRVYGRLRAGASEEQASHEIAARALGLEEQYPRHGAPRRLRLDDATWIDSAALEAERSTLRLMMIAAGGLLLLVVANVANLLLAVALGHQREASTRAALGASPGRLMRQVLLQNLLLSGLAGILALALAAPASARLGSYFARPSVWGANVAREATIDFRVVAFAIGISLLIGVVAGLFPAIRATRWNLVETLKAGGGSSIRGPRLLFGLRVPGLHDLLVAAQVALAVILLVVAGLVIRTFVKVANLDPGFATDQLIVTHISTSSTTLEVEEREAFFRELVHQLSDEPWVTAATVVDFPLLSAHPTEEMRLQDLTDPVELVYSRLVPGFFEALGIDVVEGRSFTADDTNDGPDVALVNEALARRYFPDGSALGRRIWRPNDDGSERAYEIVGVARDTKTRDLFADAEPTVYLSYPQHAYPSGSALIVATRSDPEAQVPQLYGWLRDFEPHLAIVNVLPYRRVVSGFLYTQRMNAEMFTVLAFLGLAIAAVGILSVMSLAVDRRTKEIGIRISIGAQRADVMRLVVARALVPVAIGLIVGLATSFVITRLVRSLLFEVEVTDPLSIAAGVGVLVVAALVAAYVPALRASTIDPVEALRAE